MNTTSLLNSHRFPALLQAKHVLCSGGIIAVPTDTLYGLVGDATNELAIQKMFAMKRRPMEKTFPIFVKDIPTARKLAYVADAKAQFLERIWPGPVTVVFHHKEKLPKFLTGPLETIGIRIPDHPFVQELLQKLDFPLVQTSANISNFPPAKTVHDIEKYFSDSGMRPDLIIDDGPARGSQSTVIDYTRHEPKVLRTGAVSKDELDLILNDMR